jgi:hypothetical protein
MKSQTTRFVAILLSALFVPAIAADTTLPDRGGVIVHEWGTFTSVAAPDGSAVQWAPLAGPGDLPCFVVRDTLTRGKWAPAYVRMETPVVYFYSERPATLSGRVDFPQGQMTEWYPKASLVHPSTPTGRLADGRLEWSKVELRPGDDATLPTTSTPNHYFAARATDASMLRVGDQREKLLFYRGVANFVPPVLPKFNADGKIEVRNIARAALPLVMVFENHQGKIGYRVARDVGNQVTLDPPELKADVAEVHQRLAAALEESGLYRKEAAAMVETWKDSWFEEGMRVMYIMPQSVVDGVLPLTISPAPSAVSRVFVGRVEVLSPNVRRTIESAVAAGDVEALARWGRFLGPFELEMRHTSDVVRSAEGQRVLSRANARLLQDLKVGACVQ